MLRLLGQQQQRLMSAAAAAAPSGPISTSIARKLSEYLKPASLVIQNDSSKHAGHAGNPGGGPDAETHFKVDIVSAAFEGKSAVERHRMVYSLLQAEIDAGVHALALKTKTPAEAGL